MITLRKHVLPSLLALLLLSTSACTSGDRVRYPVRWRDEQIRQARQNPQSPPVSAAVPQVAPVSAVDARTVLEAFRSRDMVGHMEALQRVADANGGNRASGTSGYEESARYVEEQLRAAGYTPVRQTFTFRGDGRGSKRVESFNILADTGGSAEHTVVVGAHLDSVQEGPGINDNASGVAAVLETAGWMKEAGITPANRVRFAFWGGEEDGLYGSQHYVDELSQAEIEPDRGEPERGHGGLAERRAVRARRRRVRFRARRAGRVQGDRGRLLPVLQGELAAGGTHAL